MGRHVNRKFLVCMIHSYHLSRKDHYFRCVCYKCRRLVNLINELGKNNFYTSNLKHKKWFVIFHHKLDSKITVFPVFI